ncbi:hypothetical protein TARUN_4424 [Trichoderma arundinaceum]|uniref:Uncharacterized protein n=1 Tax=Trichoderma arundinaceum TaxID=490622 RepID=A0A395NPC9_TRIAR|nr:hypothetical protein TARUN_4424 [Trichoderma arundinaceum]
MPVALGAPTEEDQTVVSGGLSLLCPPIQSSSIAPPSAPRSCKNLSRQGQHVTLRSARPGAEPATGLAGTIALGQPPLAPAQVISRSTEHHRLETHQYPKALTEHLALACTALCTVVGPPASRPWLMATAALLRQPF